MTRLLLIFAIACMGVVLAGIADWIVSEGYLFGLWTGIFGGTVGLSVAAIGVVIAVFFVIYRKPGEENTQRYRVYAWQAAAVGVLMTALSYLVWAATGRPWFP